jgi:hypothetical protein
MDRVTDRQSGTALASVGGSAATPSTVSSLNRNPAIRILLSAWGRTAPREPTGAVKSVTPRSGQPTFGREEAKAVPRRRAARHTRALVSGVKRSNDLSLGVYFGQSERRTSALESCGLVWVRSNGQDGERSSPLYQRAWIRP